MLKILGIDPGSRFTGYGVIDLRGSQPHYVASGCIQVMGDTIASKLQCIHAGIKQVISMYQPVDAAIEKIFMARNPDSALKLGQARGVAILAVAEQDIPLAEYSARQVKQAVVGKGNAGKEQVQHMVKSMLQLSAKPQADAADALAIAVCHMHTLQSLAKMSSVRGVRGSRLY